MKAWQYTTATGGLEANLTLVTTFPDPSPSSLKKDEILVKVLSISLNPADFKVPEFGFVMQKIIGSPAIPCMDFAGRVEAVHSSNTALKKGQLVFGRLDPMTRVGTLGEFTVAKSSGCVPIPEGLDVDQAATVGTAGLTSHQVLAPYLKKPEMRVFINGGSGGTGVFAIQIAKALGAHVTTTCSTGNIGLVKELGVDEVIDYTKTNVIDALAAEGQVYDHAVDNIGIDPGLYAGADKFLKPGATYVQVGLPASAALGIAKSALLPGFLGGGKRGFKFFTLSKNVPEGFVELGDWMKEGKVKVPIQEVFEFEDAAKAFAAVRSGRVKGKVVVRVAKE